MLVTVEQAAEMLGFKEASVYQKIYRGQLEVQKLDGRVFLDTESEINKPVFEARAIIKAATGRTPESVEAAV